jgi:hypothetical protein
MDALSFDQRQDCVGIMSRQQSRLRQRCVTCVAPATFTPGTQEMPFASYNEDFPCFDKNFFPDFDHFESFFELRTFKH